MGTIIKAPAFIIKNYFVWRFSLSKKSHHHKKLSSSHTNKFHAQPSYKRKLLFHTTTLSGAQSPLASTSLLAVSFLRSKSFFFTRNLQTVGSNSKIVNYLHMWGPHHLRFLPEKEWSRIWKKQSFLFKKIPPPSTTLLGSVLFYWKNLPPLLVPFTLERNTCIMFPPRLHLEKHPISLDWLKMLHQHKLQAPPLFPSNDYDGGWMRDWLI